MSTANTSTPNNTAVAVDESEESTENLEGTEESSDEVDESAEPEAKAAGQPKQVKTEAKKVAEIKKELKKLKIKFNGKEEDVEFDPNDDDYLAKQFQFAKLGQTKAQEYSKLEKEVEQFINILKTNPRAILTDPTIGVDLKKFAAEIMDEEIANSRKSPEQLEKERLEKELKNLKDEQKKKEDEYKAKEFERMQEMAYQQYDQQIHTALEKADIPKNSYTIKKIADYMLIALQNNMDVTADDVVPLVRQEIQADIKEMFGVMPDEVLEQLIGKDVMGRLRKKAVSKAKQLPRKAVDVNKPKVVAKTDPAPKKTIRQLFGV